jgi:hypothetical protein
MISKAEIETYATKISEKDFKPTPENMLAVIGHLSQDEFDLVYARACEIHNAGIEAIKAESNSFKNLSRLAHAAGCPPGVKVLPWLAERGLVEQIAGVGWRITKAKPRSVR